MSGAKRDSVSVIIPAYNAANYISEAINCILDQTHPPDEILVIDDGSKDETEAVCKSFGNRIRYIRTENMGVSSARNKGLQEATSEFVSLLDADDVCVPERLARQVKTLRENPSVVCCLSGHWVFSSKTARIEYPGISERARFGKIDFFCSLLCHPITMMFRRKYAVKLDFPVGVKTGEDMIFTALLRGQGEFIILPEVLYGYRRHATQSTASFTSMDSLRLRLAWLKENREREWPEVSYEEVESAMWRAHADALALSYWTRRKDEFLALREELRKEWPTHLQRPPELNLRWYNDWLWNMKSMIDSWRGRSNTKNSRKVERNTDSLVPLVTSE